MNKTTNLKIERDVEESIAYGLTLLENIRSLPGTKVIDTSAVLLLLEGLHNNRALVSDAALRVREHLIKEVPNKLNEGILYSQVVAEEFEHNVAGVKSVAKEISKRNRRIGIIHRRRGIYDDECSSKRQVDPEIVDRIGHLGKRWANFKKDAMVANLLEDRIGEESRAYLPDFEADIIRMARRDGLQIDYNPRYNDNPSSGLNMNNDPLIFARTLALGSSATIITCDSDFVRMLRNYERICKRDECRADTISKTFPVENIKVAYLPKDSTEFQLIEPQPRPSRPRIFYKPKISSHK